MLKFSIDLSFLPLEKMKYQLKISAVVQSRPLQVFYSTIVRKLSCATCLYT